MDHATIRGHDCGVRLLARRDHGTFDVEVIACASCPGLVGQCFRVSGVWSGAL